MQILKLEHLADVELSKYENITVPKIQKSNFQKAFYLLSKEKRIAISNFYLFCAYLDDIVDDICNNDIDNKNIAKERLNNWKNIINSMYNGMIPNKLAPLWEVFDKYKVSCDLVIQLVEGIERDLYCNRYSSFDALLKYCYGVASIVGLICIHIFTEGNSNEKLQNYAINLGYALQITNIMRDIGEDCARDYIYIPQDILQKFNYSEDDIRNKVYNQNFYDLMAYLHQQAIKYYDLVARHYGDIISSYDYSKNLKTSQCINYIYFKLLNKIKDSNYTIYDGKIRISTIEKLLIFLQLWIKK